MYAPQSPYLASSPSFASKQARKIAAARQAFEQTRSRPPLLLLVAICVVSFLISWAIGPLGLPSAGAVLNWVVLMVLLHWVGVVVHEMGHAGFGLSKGMTLRQFAVGPLLIDWSKGNARVRGNAQRGLHGGFVRFSGENVIGTEGSIRAHFWMTLGGPAVGLLYGIVLLEMGSLLSPDRGWLKYGFLFSGLWAIGVSVVNLLPLRNGLSRSDGSWLLALSRGGDEARELIASIYWIDLLHGLTPPGNWPFEVVEAQEAALLRKQPMTENQLDLAVTAGYLLYYHHADREDWIEANHVITRAADLPRQSAVSGTITWETFNSQFNSRFDAIDVMLAAHLALRGKNPRGARSALGRIHPRAFIRRNSLFIGTEAAIALLEDDPVTALERATLAREILAPSLLDVAADQIEDSWWSEVIAQARRAIPPPGVLVTKPAPQPAPAAAIPQAAGVAASAPVVPAAPVLPAPPAVPVYAVVPMVESAKPAKTGRGRGKAKNAPAPAPAVMGVATREELFAWDPGVPSDQRLVWIWRGTTAGSLELSA